MRFDTSMVIAGLPLTRVIEVGVLEGRRDLGDVAERHRRPSGDATTGNLQDVLGVSISAGTLTAKRPVSPSSAPAATRLLQDCVIEPISWSSEMP